MINSLSEHKSVRKYSNKQIPENVLNEVLFSGTRASTTGNMQVYSIIVTSDEKVKNELWAAHFKQDMVKQAPIVITFCADFNRFNLWCRMRKAKPGYDNFLSFVTAAVDALLVAQNVALAAEEKGLGICYLGTTTYLASKIIEILQIPSGVVPVTTLVMGYPNENPPLTDRLPLEAVVHQNVYKNYTTTDIETYYKEKEVSPFYQDIVLKNNKETLAQVFTDCRYTLKDNQAFSQGLLKVLKDQGFMNNEG